MRNLIQRKYEKNSPQELYFLLGLESTSRRVSCNGLITHPLSPSIQELNKFDGTATKRSITQRSCHLT